MNQFIWEPGDGYDKKALKRLQNNFIMPHSPMGEAWLMDQERFYYKNLLEGVGNLRVDDLQTPLHEIIIGTKTFGSIDEWVDWYHYLFAQLLPRSHESSFEGYLLEYLVSGFIIQYPNGIHREPYKGFKEDAINMMGKCIMGLSYWSGSHLTIGATHPKSKNSYEIYGWWDVDEKLSSSIFFCLKYLPVEAIESWFESILKILCPYWRAQILVWLVGANDMLCDKIQQPSQFKDRGRPRIDWTESHLLSGGCTGNSRDVKQIDNFIPAENRVELLNVISRYITEDLYLEWLLSISNIAELEFELAEIPGRFIDIYLSTDATPERR